MRTLRGVIGAAIGIVLTGLSGCGPAPGVIDGGAGSGGGDAGPAPDLAMSGTGGAAVPGLGGAMVGVGGSGAGGTTDAMGGAPGTGGNDTGTGGNGTGGATGSGGAAGAPDSGSGGASVGGAGGTIPPLPAGSPLPLCTTVRDCAAGNGCVPALGLSTTFLSEGHCISDGIGAGQCRAASPHCDAGFGCDPNPTNICVPAVAAGESCTASLVCPDGTRCLGDTVGTNQCVPDGVSGGLCRAASPRCDAGLGCLGAVCAPLSADGLCDPGATACPEGSSCVDGRCAPIGAAGGDCRSTSPACDSGLVCQTVFTQTVVQRCTAGAGEGESCTGILPCLDGLFCDFASGLCQRAGDLGSTCFSGVPCRSGLLCDFNTGLCSRGGTLNTQCRTGAICDDGLICSQVNQCRPAASVIPDGAPCNSGFLCESGAVCNFNGGPIPVCVRFGAPRPPPCGDGCAPGLVCDILAAHCAVPVPVGDLCNAQICVAGAGCAAGPAVAARCRIFGTQDGPCRPEAAAVTACDPGLICQTSGISITPAISSSSCQPATIPPGGACLTGLAPTNYCAPPAACISSVCVLPGQFGGACRRHDAGGSCDPLLGCLAGRCVSGLGDGATCDRASTTSVCANPYVCAGPDGESTCQLRGYDQTAVASDFFDACASGIHVTLLQPGTFSSRDNNTSSMPIVIPFPFHFWGVTYPQVVPSVNGVLLFAGAVTAAQGATAIGNGYLPSDQFGPAIAAFWDDLRLGDPPGADICYQLVGAPPARRLVVQWKGAHRLSRAAVDLDFEVVLHESDVVELAYRTLSPTSGDDAPWADGSRAAIGLQSGYSGRAVVHAGAVVPSVALRFTPR